VQFERLHRVAVVRRDEHHGGRLLEPGEAARHLEPIHARHLDIEQQHARAALRHGVERLEAVARLPRDLGGQLRRQVAEQLLQPLARRRLVVGNEDFERSHGEL